MKHFIMLMPLEKQLKFELWKYHELNITAWQCDQQTSQRHLQQVVAIVYLYAYKKRAISGI